MMIDIFNHFMPKAYLDRLGTLIPGHVVLTAFPRLRTLWDVDARLALLDAFDGLQQVLSLANQPLELIASPTRRPSLPAWRTTRWRSSAASTPIAFRPSSRRCR
jgi:aminocarboxymuconate-semialdehyde decarboxylase